MTTYKPDPFYNRVSELAALDRAWTRQGGGGQMMLLYGRRRIGKTYLLQRYFVGGISGDDTPRPYCYFLAEQTAAAAQRLMLARELLAALPSEGIHEEEIAVSWNALLRYVSQQVSGRKASGGHFALILDEFPYLVEQSPELPSVLQAWWDREGIHINLFVVLCGSQLSAMAALGRESAPMFGRFNAGIFLLEPLSYYDVASFYAAGSQYGIADTLLMYGVLGGTPRYHALVDTTQPAAAEIVTLLMQQRAVLENEVRFLLGSEQIRDPSPYNAVLGAIAGGATRFGRIQDQIQAERSTLSFYLRTLQDFGWIRREFPFGETSERRALYRIDDPFLSFWYRFVAPLSSALQFSDARQIYESRVAPYLADYMGTFVFEDICAQWLRRFAQDRLQLTIRNMGRYWNRDGSTEIDIVAELDNGEFLFGECKWRADSTAYLSDYSRLQAKVTGLPNPQWKNNPILILFAVGGFDKALLELANDPKEQIILVTGADLLA
jgi:AAA+ ATPase superfamily predicted ATPase